MDCTDPGKLKSGSPLSGGDALVQKVHLKPASWLETRVSFIPSRRTFAMVLTLVFENESPGIEIADWSNFLLYFFELDRRELGRS